MGWFRKLFSSNSIDREAQRELIQPAKGRKDPQDQSPRRLLCLDDPDDSFLL